MKVIAIIVIIVVVLWFFIRRHGSGGSEFQSYLKEARKGFGQEAIAAMALVAYKYAAGGEVEQNYQKAAEWMFKRLEAMLGLKVYWQNSVFYDFSSEITEVTEFFLSGREVPVDLAKARKAAERLFYAGEPCSVFLLQEVEALEQMGIGEVKDIKEAVQIYRKYAQENNHFAMYRLINYYRHDKEHGKEVAEWTEKAWKAGNLRIMYDENRGNDEKRRETMQVIRQEYQKLKLLYWTERYVSATAIENAQKELEGGMAAGAGGEVSAQIDYLLEKAGWPAAAAYSEPTGSQVPDEAVQKFMKARALEKEGKNFQKAAKLYQPAAEAGHVEAQRRLGNILCRVRSAYDGDDVDLAGKQWLEKAASAGSVLASFDLHKKDTNPAEMAALARTGNVEALYDLAFMMTSGWGGPANVVVGKSVAHLAWNIVGDPVKAADGEGMEWKRKIVMLGNQKEEYEKDQLYWTGNAEKIGYAPGIYVLCNLPFARKGGTEFQLQLAQKAANAGYERAWVVVRYLKKEKDNVEYEFRSDIERAAKVEEESNYHPGEYVAIRKEHWTNKIKTFRECCKQEGLPDQRNVDIDVQSEPAFDEEKLKEELEADTSSFEITVNDMPLVITDDLGRTWERISLIGDAAEYALMNCETFIDGDTGDVLNRGSVYISNHHISGNTARLFTRTFHW